jgi:hypothetical protein
MTREGDLLAVTREHSLVRIGWDSNLKWKLDLHFHHKIQTDGKGNIYVATNNVEFVPYGDIKLPILNDYLTVVSPEGAVQKKVSVYKLFGTLIPKDRFETIRTIVNTNSIEFKTIVEGNKIGNDDWRTFNAMDVFHVNTVAPIERSLGALGKKGAVLVSLHNLDTIAIVDLDAEKVLWTWGTGIIKGPHGPILLKNNHILLFDNQFNAADGKDNWGDGKARVVEVDPATKKIRWEYRGESSDLKSVSRGGVQELPNGNILITEAQRSHVFEITRSGKVVWEYYGLRAEPKASDIRGTFYQAIRYPLAWLH